MKANSLKILCCPYCGGDFSLDDGRTLVLLGDEIVSEVLRCQCDAYPIVDGIPVLRPGYAGNSFQQRLAEHPDQVLGEMLDLDEEGQVAFEHFLALGASGTYQECLELFCPGDEGPYFVHRFSNPTYLVGQTILRALGGDERCFARRAIDLGGGSGHLVRAVCQLSNGAEVWLGESTYWKLWLARRAVAPDCLPICLDAEAPLPFKQGSFSLALCSDAFHYIWSKRMFASEMMRLVDADGVIVINHVHNALQNNHSAGLPLPPQQWRRLFMDHGVRIFKETELLDSIIEDRPIDLSRNYTDEELIDEQALLLIVTKMTDLFRVYRNKDIQFTRGVWRINPLYHIDRTETGAVLCLKFPSGKYEDEYGATRRYLPAKLELASITLKKLAMGEFDDELRVLAERYILLNVPQGYP